MYDPISPSRIGNVATDVAAGEQSAVLGKVHSLLGFAFLFTAGGVLLGVGLGADAVLVAIGSFATLIALMFAREKSPLNLVPLHAFATFEGMLLGLVLEDYVASGSGAVVLDAAATTVAVTLAAGTYGYTTHRNLAGMGGILTVA